MTSPAITLETLRSELAPYTPNADSVAVNLLPFVNEHLAEAYLAGNISTEDAGPRCPIPRCGAPLSLTRSLDIPVTASRTAHVGVDEATSESWRLVCEAGHVLDAGGEHNDGRDIAAGWSSAHALGKRE